ncbi:MAG: SHOCT domain-containing protein [Planctomycetota bacterium]|jgi:putative membrane protein
MRRIASVLVTVFLVAISTLPSLAQGVSGREFYGHHDWGYGHMIFGGLMMLAFWAGIIVLIVLAVRWASSSGRERPSGRQSALEILQERYARGEIDHDEFEQRKQLLTE